MPPNDDTPDMVNRPPHYTSHPSGVECITVTEHMNFCVGNAIKYLWRAGSKGAPVEDLKKARWYIDREICRVSGETSEPVCIICCRPGAAGRTCESGAPCVGADETAETEVERLRASLRLANEKLDATEREAAGMKVMLQNSHRYAEYIRGELSRSDERMGAVTEERNEAKRVAAQLTTCVADLEAQLADVPARIARAVMAEREACAMIAEVMRAKSRPNDGDSMRPYNFLRTDSFYDVMCAIRNRPVPDGWTPPNGSETAKGGG